MKKILYLFFGLFLIMPLNTNALAKGKIILECDNSVKKNASVTCKVVLNVEEGIITSLSATFKGDGIYFNDGGNINVVGNYSESNNILQTDNSIISTSTFGTGSITLSNIVAKDDENNDVNLSVTPATVKVLNNNSKINNIKIDDKDISTYGNDITFSPDNTDYTINISKKSSVNITVVKDNTVSIQGTGRKNLVCGVNNIELKATSEDNSSSTVYKLVINRECNSDTTLKKITISSGKLNPSYVASTRNYNVDVTKDIDKITISVEKNDETQKVTGTVKDVKLNFGENKFVLTVVAESGATKDYTIVVNRQDTRSTNNNLKNIEIESAKLNPMFSSDVLEYNVKVLYEVTKLNITYETEEENAKVEVIGNVDKLNEGENLITLKVTSEHGEVKEYKINVTKLKENETLGDNPDITSIIVSGYDIKFNKSQQVYSIKIKNEKELDIKVELEDNTSTYKIAGNENLKDGSIIKIISTSKDGSTREYRIIIEKESKVLLYIIGILVVLSVIGLIIYIILNKKKNNNNPNSKKEKVTTRIIKNNKKSDLDLEKIEQQIKEINAKKETENEFTKPITIIPNNVNDLTNEKEEKNDDNVKTCIVCGHKILNSLDICPYCKHKF